MLPLALLVALSCAFRLPALLNAAAVDSDSAIVGLQAMHILRGEWSPFLFGSGYQTSVDSFVAAGFFAVLGPTPLALMLSTFAGHLALTGFVFAALGRHLRPWLAASLVLPLVFTPSPLHTYILGPPRQAALTLVFASVWLLDGASGARRPLAVYALGGGLAAFACFADPYALLFFPALMLLAALATRDGEPRDARSLRLASVVAGTALGAVPLLVLWGRPDAAHGELGLTRAVLAHNGRLLVDECLPWILSTTVYRSANGLPYAPWRAPLGVRVVELAGAVIFLAGVLSGAALASVQRIPWEVRRLGVAGAVVLPLTLAGFLSSVMVMDLFSTRYLAAMVLAAPLAFAPAGYLLGQRRAALAIAPYAASAALAGWLGFGSCVDGVRPVRTASGGAVDEARLQGELARRGVAFAEADYWVSYRLTFLYREAPAVVPIHAREDRYAPYRAGFDTAAVVAYVFDPRRSREDRDEEERALLARRECAGYERVEAGELSALVLRRAPILTGTNRRPEGKYPRSQGRRAPSHPARYTTPHEGASRRRCHGRSTLLAREGRPRRLAVDP